MADKKLIVTEPNRDEKGRFGSGNSGGPGRPLSAAQRVKLELANMRRAHQAAIDACPDVIAMLLGLVRDEKVGPRGKIDLGARPPSNRISQWRTPPTH